MEIHDFCILLLLILVVATDIYEKEVIIMGHRERNDYRKPCPEEHRNTSVEDGHRHNFEFATLIENPIGDTCKR